MNDQPQPVAAPVAVPAKTLTWAQFALATCKVAKKDRNDSIITGLKAKGREYSLAADLEAGDLDSLGVTETIMNVEEEIGVILNLGGAFQIPENVTDGAKNIGEIYDGICAVLHIEPDYADAPDFSAYPDQPSKSAAA